jgi:O-methyltransferase
MLRHAMIAGAKRTLRHLGWELRRAHRPKLDNLNPFAPRMSDEEGWVLDIVERVRPYTMTPVERVASLCHAIEYVRQKELSGDVLECGVWRGGSMMAAALALIHFKDTTRRIYLFDTYEGMTPPTSIDKRVGLDLLASEMLASAPRSHYLWGVSSIEEVKTNLSSTGYPQERLHFIKGPVEHTIPAHAPDQICILRLDTDWYESTRHELVHLYPRLQEGGVLILDDYGWWEGQRRASDEYIREGNLALLLVRTDSAGGRIAIKTP